MGWVKLENLGNNKYKLVVEGEDHTIGNLLAKTLLSMDDVKFAYYERPHPLEGRIVVFFQLKDPEGDPVKVLGKALDRILEVNEGFKKLYLEAVKDKGLELEERS